MPLLRNVAVTLSADTTLFLLPVHVLWLGQAAKSVPICAVILRHSAVSVKKMMKKLLIKLIRFYQKKISPHTRASCRYVPTCSGYAIDALETHGAIKGSLLAILRILRCNPLFKGGYDPVPPKGRWRNT